MLALFLRSKKSLRCSPSLESYRKTFQFFFRTRPEIPPFCTVGFRSRYISRYVDLKFGFLPFVVASNSRYGFLTPYLQLAPRRWGTARTELGSSHSSWKGSRLLSTPATAACLTCRPDIVCPNRLGGMMQPAKTAHGAFLAHPSWGPRKAGRLCGERRSSVVIELSCLHGSERYAACFDEVVARAVRVSQPAVLSALLVIQLFGIVIPPPYFS